MKTLKEIYAEAKIYDPSEPLQDAFVAGARFALNGKYYKPAELFQENKATLIIGNNVEVIEKPTFDEWWNLYAYKKGRSKTEAKWNHLSLKDKGACYKATAAYVANTVIPSQASPSDRRQFRMHPLTYLNGKRWEDEIYPVQSYEQQHSAQLAAKAASILGDPT